MGTRKTRHLYSCARFLNRSRRRLGRPPTPSARRCSAPCATRRRRRRGLVTVTPLDEEKRATGTEKRGASAPRSTATGRARRRRRRRPRARDEEKTRFFGAARRRVSLREAPPAPTRTAADRSGAGAGRTWMLKTAKRTSVMRYQAWRRYQRGDRKRCGRRGAARTCARGAHRRRNLPRSRRDRASRASLLRRLLPGPGRVRVPHATLSRSSDTNSEARSAHGTRDRRAPVDSAARLERGRVAVRGEPRRNRDVAAGARREESFFFRRKARRRKARRKARRRTAFVWHETRKPRNSVRFERTHEPDFAFSRNLVAKTKKRFRKLGTAVRGVGGGTRRGARGSRRAGRVGA